MTVTPAHAPIDADRFAVGTLKYTPSGLRKLFAWLLWGDFCFMLMETIVPSIVPLKLKALGAPNWVLALVLSTLPGVLNMTICPWVSFKSDRHRGPYGRRIPYIVKTLPFLAVFLVLLAFVDPIGSAVHGLLPSAWGFSRSAVTIGCVGVFVVGFQFFNMFVNSVFWYLFNDVVPPSFLGRFMGLFRVVVGLKSMLYSFFVFQYAESHMTEIFVGVTALYVVGFGLMCCFVREGDYPPVQDDGSTGGVMATVKTYARECYRERFYWHFFLANACGAIVLVSATYQVFFYKSLGLTLASIGMIGGIVNAANLLISYPAGVVADRVHPLRMIVWLRTASLALSPLMLIWLVFDFSPGTAFWLLLAINAINLPVVVAAEALNTPLYMRVLPQARYGQFCSATALVRSCGVIVGGLLLGLLLDGIARLGVPQEDVYRYLPLWDMFWTGMSLFFIIRVRDAALGRPATADPVRGVVPDLMPAPVIAALPVTGAEAVDPAGSLEPILSAAAPR